MYGAGEAERVLGRALKALGDRDRGMMRVLGRALKGRMCIVMRYCHMHYHVTCAIIMWYWHVTIMCYHYVLLAC